MTGWIMNAILSHSMKSGKDGLIYLRKDSQKYVSWGFLIPEPYGYENDFLSSGFISRFVNYIYKGPKRKFTRFKFFSAISVDLHSYGPLVDGIIFHVLLVKITSKTSPFLSSSTAT